MSVVGIDVGNDTSCVALARKRGIDVLMNKESKRETPAAINFGDKMRFLGTDGYGKLGLAPQNTVHQLKRLLGKKFRDPAVQADAARLPFALSEGPDGGVLIHVTYCNEPATFTPEQVLAMVLVDLKRIVEAEAGLSVTDCVLSVPTFFTEAERYAMLNASQVAGLNCLRLINESTATALAYGIFKTDLPEAEPVNVVFVDVGHAATQVSVVSLKRSSLQVRAHAWDRNLGGRDFDEVLFEHFAAEFQAKTKRDVRSIKKAAFKLRVGVEKLKKILSANAEAPLNIECLVEDDDLRGMMTREKFEELAAPVLARLKAPMEKALADSGLTVADISSVEIVGSSTRMPAVFKAVEDVFQKPPSRTMNSKECVCRGAALQCAMLSPVFKVREFEVIDACPFTINVTWEKDGTQISQALFKRGDPFPSTKVITFTRAQPFDVTGQYSEDSDIPAAMDRTIGVYHVGPFTVPPGSETVKLKAKIRMNLHGLVSVESVQAQEEVEVVEAPKDVPMADASAAPADGAAPAEGDASGPAPMETDATKAAAAAAAKKKVKKVDVAFSASKVAGYDQKTIDRYFEQECQMQAADRLQEETNERKNALEGYVYDLRNKLSDAYSAFIKDSDKEALTAELQAMEDWLYEEGEDTTKSVYIAKLEELKAKGAPVEQRYAEAQARGPAAEALKAAADSWRAMATSEAHQYAHISAEEKGTVVREAEGALAWLKEKLALQSTLPKHETPVLVAADIHKKRETLDRLAKPIMSKPPPPPPAAPVPPPQPQPAAAAPAPEASPEAAPMDTGADSTSEKPAGEPMQE